MFKIIFFLLSFFTFNVFIFAQDAKSQTDKSRINAPEVVKISRPAKATSAKETRTISRRSLLNFLYNL